MHGYLELSGFIRFNRHNTVQYVCNGAAGWSIFLLKLNKLAEYSVSFYLIMIVKTHTFLAATIGTAISLTISNTLGSSG